MATTTTTNRVSTGQIVVFTTEILRGEDESLKGGARSLQALLQYRAHVNATPDVRARVMGRQVTVRPGAVFSA